MTCSESLSFKIALNATFLSLNCYYIARIYVTFDLNDTLRKMRQLAIPLGWSHFPLTKKWLPAKGSHVLTPDTIRPQHERNNIRAHQLIFAIGFPIRSLQPMSLV